MGNKNSSSQSNLNKSISINGQEHESFCSERNESELVDRNSDILSYQSQLNRKYGPSPRPRRRSTKTNQIEKKNRKSQPVSSFLSLSSQSITDGTVSLFSRSFNFLNSTTPNNSTGKNSSSEQGALSSVYRNQSRRKYQTSSLRNPYRRSSTNFPVRGHEAVFLPEFSIKGKITEADFDVLDIIARGAFGNVIKVCSIHDKKIYAMKIMSKSQIVKDNAVQQVKDEVTIAQSCRSHPFIVQTHGYWQSRRYLYIITDHVENGELLSLWLKIRRFPELIVKIYIAQVAMVLEYLHHKGIIYRDVKMENILLDEDGNLKIIDFGLSKWLPLGQRTTTICGTLQYIAPEVLSVRPYDHRVDWWSLGILMYACLFGEYPVSATKDHVTMANKVLNHKFHFPSIQMENSQSTKQLLFHLLEKNPNQRLCTLDDLRQTPFMAAVDFDKIYSKSYSPLKILMNTKIEWHKELQAYYYQRPRNRVLLMNSQNKHQYENFDQTLVSK